MEFEDIVKNRYATKKFDGKKIPEEDLNKLLEMIRSAPSSFNMQPWKIIVISNQELKEKLSPASYNQAQITDCSHLLVFCANKNLLEKISEIEKQMRESGMPSEKMNTYIGMMKDFEKNLTDEQRLSWAQRQMFLALGNALNGAKSLGFDSCPMEGFNPEEYSKILELPENIVPTALCTVGYATDELKPKRRLPKESVFDFRD